MGAGIRRQKPPTDEITHSHPSHISHTVENRKGTEIHLIHPEDTDFTQQKRKEREKNHEKEREKEKERKRKRKRERKRFTTSRFL
jgi:hypothetical protein